MDWYELLVKPWVDVALQMPWWFYVVASVLVVFKFVVPLIRQFVQGD